MTRRRRTRSVFLATLLCIVVVALVAFTTRDWIAQTVEAIAFVTPTPTFDADSIAPDTLYTPYTVALRGLHVGRAAPHVFP